MENQAQQLKAVLRQIGLLYNSENFFLSFIKVLYHKAYSAPVKRKLEELMEENTHRTRWMKNILRKYEIKTEESSEAIHGVFKEILKNISRQSQPKMIDEVIASGLITVGYFKIGLFKPVLLYAQDAGFDHLSNWVQSVISYEEQLCEELTHIFLFYFSHNVFQPVVL